MNEISYRDIYRNRFANLADKLGTWLITNDWSKCRLMNWMAEVFENKHKNIQIIASKHVHQRWIQKFQKCLGVFRPTHMETSPLPVKDCKFWPMLGNHGHWAERVLWSDTTSLTRGSFPRRIRNLDLEIRFGAGLADQKPWIGMMRFGWPQSLH